MRKFYHQCQHGRHRFVRALHRRVAEDRQRPNSRSQPCRSRAPSEQDSFIEEPRVLRRNVLLAGAAGTIPLLQPGQSQALVTLQDDAGRDVAAYEMPFRLKVVALQSAVPPQLILDFRTTYRKYAGVEVGSRESLQEIFKELEAGAGPGGVPASGRKGVSAADADLVSLGDQWLAPCIRRGLLRPFPDPQLYRYWGALSPAWQRLVQRDARGGARSGAPVWGVPYRWGCTLIAFRKDKFRELGIKPIADWPDLLQPALRGRVAFMDSPRDLVGAAFKTLGLGYNSTAREMAQRGVTVEKLAERVSDLCAQTRVFSDTQHLAALYGGDAWVSVGNCLDIMQLKSRSAKVDAVAPSSGTSLWADLWVRPFHPKEADASPLIPLWVEQYLFSGRETTRLGLQLGFRPHQLDSVQAAASRDGHKPGSLGSAALTEPLTSASTLDHSILARSEFLLPLNDDMAAVYNRVLAPLVQRAPDARGSAFSGQSVRA